MFYCVVESPQFRVGASPRWFRQSGKIIKSRRVFLTSDWYGHHIYYGSIDDIEGSIISVRKEAEHGN